MVSVFNAFDAFANIKEITNLCIICHNYRTISRFLFEFLGQPQNRTRVLGLWSLPIRLHQFRSSYSKIVKFKSPDLDVYQTDLVRLIR
jgi:hypothetical protein